MKKVIREWAFSLFTKRITVKMADLPNDAKIEYLVNKLMNELVAQEHDIRGVASDASEFFSVFSYDGKETVDISSNSSCNLSLKRLTKV